MKAARESFPERTEREGEEWKAARESFPERTEREGEKMRTEREGGFFFSAF